MRGLSFAILDTVISVFMSSKSLDLSVWRRYSVGQREKKEKKIGVRLSVRL